MNYDYWHELAYEALCKFENWVGRKHITLCEWEFLKIHEIPLNLPQDKNLPQVINNRVFSLPTIGIRLKDLDVTPLATDLERYFGHRNNSKEEILNYAWRRIMDAATYVFGG